LNLKITGKNVANFSDPWAACKTWSSNEFFSAAVLKQRKRASVKNSNTEAGPVPFALFDQNSTRLASSLVEHREFECPVGQNLES